MLGTGSLERMIGILTEHTGGKWPFWLSPRQIAICTVTDKVLSFATSVYERLKSEKFYVELFGSNNETLPKKIRYLTFLRMIVQTEIYFLHFFFTPFLLPLVSSNMILYSTAQVEQYNFILVIGEEEMRQEKVNVRTRDGTVVGLKDVEEFIRELKQLQTQMK
jgi:threonyl-tRNA synthetase